MSFEGDLLIEKITHLDLSEYTVVASSMSVRDVIHKMRTERHNCAFVLKGGKLVGIFTDRDVLKSVVDRPEVWDGPIDAVMTHGPEVIGSDKPVGDAMNIMETSQVRNIPVQSPDGTIIGNLTHFALIRYLADHFPREVYNLPPEPDQFGEERHGG